MHKVTPPKAPGGKVLGGLSPAFGQLPQALGKSGSKTASRAKTASGPKSEAKAREGGR